MNKENKNLATLEISSKSPPTLKPGDIDPELARRFENACRNFFSDKGVKEEDQVKRVLNSSFHDDRMIHWVDCNRVTLEALKFDEFMVEFRSQWLETHWSQQLDSRLRVMRQNRRPFKEWYNDFYSQSLLLKNTPDEMSDKDVRRLIYSLMDPHLRSRADLERVRSIDSLKGWSDALGTEDRSIRTEVAFWKSIKNDEGHSVSGGSNSRGGGRGPPSLMQEERQLLNEHEGCYTCREFYIGHRSDSCSAGYPDGAKYQRLTLADARSAAAKRGKTFNSRTKVPTTTASAKDKGKGVAAATIAEVDEDVEEVDVAALADAVEYDSSSDVSSSKRLSSPSLHWDGLAWDGDSVPSLPAHCLLDCGSQLVLISDAFVSRHGLRRFQLSRPIHINVAIPELPDSFEILKSKKDIVYTQGVSLMLSSLDNRWSAKEITAVIVPRLLENCDVILGLPWLSSNRIVMDFENRSAIYV
ncbi:hypothetical protein H1R20_g12845, partial [Candolleomyces eurysporus]